MTSKIALKAPKTVRMKTTPEEKAEIERQATASVDKMLTVLMQRYASEWLSVPLTNGKTFGECTREEVAVVAGGLFGGQLGAFLFKGLEPGIPISKQLSG